MSDFSDLLSKYIQEKNIQVASMVKYCGIDRSAMYKIIKGKHHPPTVQIRDKMARFMQLTPEENRLFNRAYEISQIGKDTYFRRKEAEKVHFKLSLGSEKSRFLQILSAQALHRKNPFLFRTAHVFLFHAMSCFIIMYRISWKQKCRLKMEK